jgi:ribosomal protein S18 acetylase RimI-like enzyme
MKTTAIQDKPSEIIINPIHNREDTHYAYTEKHWLDSFPETERRGSIEQLCLLENEPRFHLKVISCQKISVGMLVYWDFTGFIFVEHLAIDPIYQNKGFGEKAMKLLIEKIRLPIVLEIELPENQNSQRRLIFYERLGFKIFSQVYEQPPYHQGQSFVPMLLLQFDPDNRLDYNKVNTILYQEVYGIR